MPAQSPSIQSFYPPSSSSSSAPSSPNKASGATSNADLADGFTISELDSVLHPSSAHWTPSREYEDTEIESLVPGPQAVCLTARIVNFFDQQTPSKMPQAARGCIKLIVKDDTAAMTVRLWYAKIEYNLRLGQLVCIWTTHVSTGNSGTLSVSSAPLMTSIFPERDRSCCFIIQERSDTGNLCKRPLGYHERQPLPGLMTLANMANGGDEVADGKVIVCIKSLGPKKKSEFEARSTADFRSPIDLVKIKTGDEKELCKVIVFDNTASAELTLWGPSICSIESWKPSETILLISRPRHSTIGHQSCITLTPTGFVDVDPDITDAVWLRSFAQKLTKRDHVNPAFPEGGQLHESNAIVAIMLTL